MAKIKGVDENKDSPCALSCRDLKTGKLLFDRELYSYNHGYQTKTNTSDRPNGEKEYPKSLWEFRFTTDGDYAITTGSLEKSRLLTCIDVQTGENVCEKEIPISPCPQVKKSLKHPTFEPGPFCTKGLVWIDERVNFDDPTLSKVVCRDIKTGETVWESKPEPDLMIRAFVDDYVILQQKRTLRCYRTADPDNPVKEILKHKKRPVKK